MKFKTSDGIIDSKRAKSNKPSESDEINRLKSLQPEDLIYYYFL